MVAILGCAGSPGASSNRPSGTAGGPVLGAGSGRGGTGSAGMAGLPTAGHGGSGGSAGSPARGTGGGAATAGQGAGGMLAGGGGNSGAAGTGAGGQGGVMTYAMLDASTIGAPVQISTAFTLAEGPIWDVCGHRLLFVDVQGGGGGGTLHALGADGQISVVMMNTGHANGIAFDIDGSLLMAQMDGHIARRDKNGMVTMIEPAGSSLHTPDDIVVRSDGTIYFTDGDFPPVSSNLVGAFSQLPVYGFKPGASTLSNGGNVGGPNGVELSPDEKTLYVDAYGEGKVYAFSVAADGTLTKGAALPPALTNPDSLCVDAAGDLYVGVSTGLQVLHPDGSMVKLIPITSSRGVTNCSFGGDDGKTLYITAWTSLWKVEGMPIPGLDWTVNTKRIACN